ncbi:MAG: aminotransferase class V-fold PLP-dependent enzyme [Acidaminococcaceae bacterium]|nr:aminotransferase class V-fold PLP-dependent enzyme [Acidaminococcaceae bacterium]
MIYLDNAATTRPKPQEVIQAVVDAMQNFGNSGRGSHDEALTAARMIYDTRNSIAKLFGGTKGENVAFYR